MLVCGIQYQILLLELLVSSECCTLCTDEAETAGYCCNQAGIHLTINDVHMWCPHVVSPLKHDCPTHTIQLLV